MVPSSLRPEWWPSWLTLTVDQDFFAIYPELAHTALAFAVLLLSAVFPRREARLLSALAAVGLAFTLVPIVEIYLRLPNHPDGVIVGWGGLYILDPFALFFKALFVISGVLAMLLSVRYLDVEKAQAGEYYALIMFAVVGMMFMASGRDLLMIFIGLE